VAVIYITDQGATLHKTGERLVVKKDKKVLTEIPALHVEQVVIFGNGHITTPAQAFLLNKGIDVAYLSSRGKYRGRLQPAHAKDVTLRQKQYKKADNRLISLEIAKSIVIGKLQNTITFCYRQRNRVNEVDAATETIRDNIRKVISADSIDSLLGYEGSASAAYFKVFRKFLRNDFGFTTRQHRPPPDPINALLSLGYTMLYNNTFAMVNVVGFDPYCGFFHQPKHGHATLASDLMEEFRAIIVDSMVLELVNHNRVTSNDFLKNDKGIRLSKGAFSLFLSTYNTRMNRPFQHPQLKRRTNYLRAIELQSRQLARVILGEENQYVPFKPRS